jgi:hypothetical protein
MDMSRNNESCISYLNGTRISGPVKSGIFTAVEIWIEVFWVMSPSTDVSEEHIAYKS